MGMVKRHVKIRQGTIKKILDEFLEEGSEANSLVS